MYLLLQLIAIIIILLGLALAAVAGLDSLFPERVIYGWQEFSGAAFLSFVLGLILLRLSSRRAGL